MLTLEEIESRISSIAREIDAPSRLFPTFGKSTDFGHPHIEVDANGYHFVIVEHGEEIKRITAFDFYEILYHVFANITFSMALDYCCKNRDSKGNFRRELYDKQIALLRMVNESFARRRQIEIYQKR